ncbi:MAG TPA: hypothetical protein VGG29_00655 [Caulobacteraceae bacterium]
MWFNRDRLPGREPSPAEVSAAIEHGLAAAASQGATPIPLRFAEIDPSRRPAPDINARQLATAFAAQLTARRRRA